MLRLDDHYLWDSWIADDGDRHHLYFLQAPRALGDPGKRHTNATIGHAVSEDLVSWEYLGECFGPSEAGHDRFDDLAIWTGSVVRNALGAMMFERFYACPAATKAGPTEFPEPLPPLDDEETSPDPVVTEDSGEDQPAATEEE